MFAKHLISRLLNSVGQTGPSLSRKLVNVGDADKALKELRFRVNNGHLFEVSRNSAVRDAFKHLTPALFSKERFQQQRQLPLTQVFAALGER